MATSVALTQVSPGKWWAGGSYANQGTASDGRFDLTGGPVTGAVVRVDVQQTSGTAAEVNPSITTTTTGPTTNVVYAATPVADRAGLETALLVSEAGRAAFRSPTPSAPVLSLWLGLDAGADNTVTWAVFIDEDWS